MTNNGNIRTRLVKPKYDNEELLKAVDTVIDELIPEVDAPNFDLVPRSEFDRVSDINDDLTNDIVDLQRELDSANTNIIDLESTIQQINIDLDQAKVSEAVAQNQVESLQLQFQQLNLDFRESLQKSIQEGIDKVSLQAQNDGLRAEVNALRADLSSLISTVAQLRERLEGREADVVEGADVVGDITILNLQQSDEFTEDVRFQTTYDDAERNRGGWRTGQEFRIRNTGTKPLTINVEHTDIGTLWMVPTQRRFILQGGESRDISFTLIWSTIKRAKPRGSSRARRSRSYDGTLVIRVDETGQERRLRTRLRKNRK